MPNDRESIVNLIDRRIREVLTEMGDRGLNLLDVLRTLDRGPKPLEEDDS